MQNENISGVTCGKSKSEENLTVKSQSVGLTITSLYDKWKRGLINLQPKWQRNFVWNDNISSSLIESMLLGIPVPAIYVYSAINEEGEECLEVIDGQQRLTAIFKFMDGEFKLTKNLEFRKDACEMSYKELSYKDQSRIKEYQMTINKIEALNNGANISESSEEIKFHVFKVINKGASQLNNQEVVACLYYGPFIEHLMDLSKNKDFLDCMNFSHRKKTRKEDLLFVLTHFIIGDIGWAKFAKNKILNSMCLFCNDKRNLTLKDQFVVEKTDSFKTSMWLAHQVFGTAGFKTENGQTGNITLFRFWSEFAKYLPVRSAIKNEHIERVRSEFGNLLKDPEFNENVYTISTNSSVTKDTPNKNKAVYFANLALALAKKCFGDAPSSKSSTDTFFTTLSIAQKNEKRFFDQALRQKMFEENPTCAVCGGMIVSPRNAEVDHIVPYSAGGKTAENNAQLVHSWCNKRKGNVVLDVVSNVLVTGEEVEAIVQ